MQDIDCQRHRAQCREGEGQAWQLTADNQAQVQHHRGDCHGEKDFTKHTRMSGKAQPAGNIRVEALPQADAGNDDGHRGHNSLDAGGAGEVDVVKQHACHHVRQECHEGIDLREGVRRVEHRGARGGQREEQDLPHSGERRHPSGESHGRAHHDEHHLNLTADGQQRHADEHDYQATGDQLEEDPQRIVAGKDHHRGTCNDGKARRRQPGEHHFGAPHQVGHVQNNHPDDGQGTCNIKAHYSGTR